MVQSNKYIQVVISSQEEVSKPFNYYYQVTKGLFSIYDTIDGLLFDGGDIIYVQIEDPVSPKEINMVINNFCNKIIQKGFVNCAEYCRMAMPIHGGNVGVVFDSNNRILKDRYVITYLDNSDKM
jgi:hypothetical protein